MASRKKTTSKSVRSGRPTATTPEERENQLISAAVDLAEQQLRDGTASAQVVTHFLKLGSIRGKLEEERLRSENRLLETKREVMESEKRTADLVQDALTAMMRYTGNAPPEEEPEYDD